MVAVVQKKEETCSGNRECGEKTLLLAATDGYVRRQSSRVSCPPVIRILFPLNRSFGGACKLKVCERQLLQFIWCRWNTYFLRSRIISREEIELWKVKHEMISPSNQFDPQDEEIYIKSIISLGTCVDIKRAFDYCRWNLKTVFILIFILFNCCKQLSHEWDECWTVDYFYLPVLLYEIYKANRFQCGQCA